MTMWNTFVNLDVNGKVFVIALYIVGVLLVILWGRFISRRLGNGLIYRLIASSAKQKIEKAESTTSRYYEYESLEKPKKEAIVWQYLLGKVAHIFKKVVLYYSSDNERNNQEQDKSPIHTKKNRAWTDRQAEI